MIGNDNENGTQKPNAGTDAPASTQTAERVRRVGIARSNDSERNEALMVAIRDHLDRNNMKNEIHVFPMNASKYDLRTSAVILAAVRQARGKNVAFYSVLYTEPADLVNYTMSRNVGPQGNQTPFDAPVTMSDVTRVAGRTAAKRCVADNLPDTGMQIAACEFPILCTALVDGKDADNSVIQGIIFSAVDAINAKIDQLNGDGNDIARETLAAMKGRVVSLKTEINPAPVVDVNGLPVRADLSFSLTSRDSNVSKENAIHDRPRPVVRADVYVQPQYNPQPRTKPLNGQLPTMLPPAFAQTTHLPEVHITNVQPQGENNSMEEIMLGVLAPSVISDSPVPYLTAAFHPRKTKSPVNLRNLGALGIDAPHLNPDLKPGEQGQPFVLDTSAPEFMNNPQAMMDLVETVFSPEPMYFLHVPEMFDLSYRMNAFVEATQSDERGQRARDEIIKALDNLTGGKFSTKWENTAPIVQHAGYRLPQGYLTDDDDGLKHDVRRLDTLALQNLAGVSGAEEVGELTDAMYNGNLDSSVREMKALRVLRHRSTGLRITGRIHVLILEHKFLDAARTAVMEAGLVNLVLSNNLSSQNDTRVRGMGDVRRFAGGFQRSFAPQNDFAQPQGNGGFGNMNVNNRWT